MATADLNLVTEVVGLSTANVVYLVVGAAEAVNIAELFGVDVIGGDA